jgi:uncharacterized protein (TIGR00369 family)
MDSGESHECPLRYPAFGDDSAMLTVCPVHAQTSKRGDANMSQSEKAVDTSSLSNGLFRRGVEGKVPVPKAAQTLGFHFVSFDASSRKMTVSFDATEQFTNPFGDVLGGFLSAMLYDTVGPALLATLGPDEFISIDTMTTNFLRPAGIGTILGTGSVIERSGDGADLEATLVDQAGRVVATATAHAMVIPVPYR